MAKEKKPSIYSDRGNIGSSEELDEYGVWVKSEPQDLSSEEIETPELSAEISGDEDMDFAIPEMEDLPDLESFDEKNSDDFSLSELPADDFAIPDIESDSATETETLPLVSDESGSDDLNLGDLAEGAEFDSLEIPNLDESLDSESSDSESPDSGGLEKSPELTDLGESGLEDDFDFPEIKEPVEESLSLDAGISGTESDDDLAGISIDTSIDDLVDNSMNELIENFDSEEEALSDGSVDLDSDAANEELVPASAQIQTEVRPETGFTTDSGLTATASTPDLSTQLLMKIAEELSSIRAELSSLKKEFSGVRAAAPQAETEEGGFFDKEDDEKISLTGDELNNILNTADFTEETGLDVTMGLSEDVTGDTGLPTGPDMEIGSDNASPDIPPDTGLSGETVSGISAEVPEEKEGEPIGQDLTMEDTNDLAKEPVEAEVSIDLEEAVIDEPDLSSEIHDNPIEEPLPDDLSVNLNIEEQLPDDTGSEEFGNLEISSDELDNLGIVTEELTIEDLNTEELGDEEPGTETLGTEELSIEVPTIEPSSTEGQSTEEPAIEDVSTEEPAVEESGTESFNIEDLSTEEPPVEEPAIEPLSTEELSTEELAIEDTSTEEPAIEEPAIEEPVSESLNAEDLNILELGDEDFVTTTEPVFEELSTEPTEEEPVSEEDFGVLVVDEPSVETTGEAEEPHEEAVVQEAVSTETEDISGIPRQLKQELKTVLSYMDQLLEALPDEKIEEFARSEYYDTYKKLFKDLGIT
jgi:hypothetical protein